MWQGRQPDIHKRFSSISTPSSIQPQIFSFSLSHELSSFGRPVISSSGQETEASATLPLSPRTPAADGRCRRSSSRRPGSPSDLRGAPGVRSPAVGPCTLVGYIFFWDSSCGFAASKEEGVKEKGEEHSGIAYSGDRWRVFTKSIFMRATSRRP